MSSPIPNNRRGGVLTYQSQVEYSDSDEFDSDDDNVEHDDDDHAEYIVGRMLGAKANPQKDRIVSVQEMMPAVPQQFHEASFRQLPLDAQTKTVKRLKNMNHRHNEQFMRGKGLLEVDENGKNVVLKEAEDTFQRAKNKMPVSCKEFVQDFEVGLLAATNYPVDENNDREVDAETYAQVMQGVHLVQQAIEKVVVYRGVEHSMFEFKKIIKLYEKSKHQKKIDAVQLIIDGLNGDLAHWRSKKSLSADKNEKDILSKKIAGASKEIEAQDKKMVDLKEREQVRRSARLKSSPHTGGRKSPLPPGCKEGSEPKRSRLHSVAENDEDQPV